MSTATREASTDIAAFLGWLHDPGDVFEIRSFKCPDHPGGRWKRTVAGWFDDIEAAEQAAKTLEQREPEGVYVTLNPVSDALLARGCNKLVEGADQTTSDTDVVRRRWLYIDIDAKRPSKVSSTAAELEAACTLAESMRNSLSARGWPEPVSCMSGNGRYLLYRVDLPNDTDALDLIGRTLEGLAAEFGTEHAEIDITGKNAARIIKLIGTMARKGDHYCPESRPEESHRPHRRSCFDIPLTRPQAVTREQLEAVATEKPEPTRTRTRSGSTPPNGSFDLDRWLADHNVPVGPPGAWSGHGKRWIFVEPPPLCDHDADGSGFVCQQSSGEISAGCHHSHCGWGWRELREHYEPGCYGHNQDVDGRRTKADAEPQRSASTSDQSKSGWLGHDSDRTENALATRLVDQCGDDFRYVPKWKKSLTWDGRRWNIDDAEKLMMRRARRFAEGLWRDFTEFAMVADRDEIGKAKTTVKAANREGTLKSLLELAKADHRVLTPHDQLNVNTDLLNVHNGTLNTKTGEFREQRREDLITQIANVSYEKNASCPRWIETLRIIFAEDAELGSV